MPEPLEPYILAAYNKSRGRKVEPRYSDFAASCAADPTLRDRAQAEFAHLDQARRGGEKLTDCDFISKTRRDLLASMLEAKEQP